MDANMNSNELTKKWNNVSKALAHLHLRHENEGKLSIKSLHKVFKAHFTDYYDLDGKIVADYGIGGGYLGMHLLSECKIKKYIGIDISDRSIENAKNNLHKWANKIEFHKSNDCEFNKLGADYLVSFAVIQHFPTNKYLDDFLLNVNNSSINTVILQIRHADENTFRDDWTTENDIKYACMTNETYVSEKLSNYECTMKSEILEKTNYHYLYYKIK